jgi:hypothetical protein
MKDSFICLLLGAVLLGACRNPEQAKIESISERTEIPAYVLQPITGNRDGDILNTHVTFTENSSTLRMVMRFRIGVPTRLEEGSYVWDQGDRVLRGAVTEISSTFLGGQSGLPSIGGTFELLSPQGERLFKVRIPVGEVRTLR